MLLPVETVGENPLDPAPFCAARNFSFKTKKKELQTTVKLLVENINRVTKYIQQKHMATSYVNLNGCNLGGIVF